MGSVRPERLQLKRRPNAKPVPPVQLSDEEKRAKAAAFAREIGQRFGNPGGLSDRPPDHLRGVTQKEEEGAQHVTGASGPDHRQREGVGAGAEGPETGQKIASSSAAARAPEAPPGRLVDPHRPNPDVPVSPTPPARTKPNKRENEFMMNLIVLRNTLRVNAPACRERARAAGKWIWRDIRLLLTLVDRIQGAMLETMPESRNEYYGNYAKWGHYELRIDGPVRNARQLLVTDMHLAAICEAAMENACIMCMKEGQEIGRCALREALLEVAPPTRIATNEKWRECEYRDAAGRLVLGEEVTV